METLRQHDKLTQKKFDKWAEEFEERGFFKYFQKRVISLINLQSNSNFLDMGCGTGWAVRYVSILLEGQGHFVGIDISQKMIEKAKELAEGLAGPSFHQASSEDLPLENNFFDNIICTFSFHHYLNPEKALSEATRVLKSKGRIYILDFTADDLLTKWIDRTVLKLEKSHVKEWSTSEFKEMFSVSGLKYIESKTILIYPIKVHIAEK
jgi:ubiquinone/menaquinone biosynthesis C-methylase UbiE